MGDVTVKNATIIQCQICLEPHSLNLDEVTKEDFPITVRCPSCSLTFEIRIDSNFPTLKVRKEVDSFTILKKTSELQMINIIEEIKDCYRTIYNKFNTLRMAVDIEARVFANDCEQRFIDQGIHVCNIDLIQAHSFYRQPYFGIPIEDTYGFNRLIVCPKFIKMKLGFTLFESLSHYFYIVNSITLDTFNIPHSLIKYLEIPEPPEISVVDNKIIGRDIILHYRGWDFVEFDIDHTDTVPSLIIKDIPKAMRELKLLGVNMFSKTRPVTIDRDTVLSVINKQEETICKSWTIDLFSKGRVVLYHPNSIMFDDFLNVFFPEISFRSILVLNRMKEIKDNAMKFTDYFRKKDTMQPFRYYVNNFQIILINLQDWAECGFCELDTIARYYNGVLGIYTNDLLDGFMMKNQLEEEKFLTPYALCPYASIHDSINYKLKKEDVSMLLTSSIEFLKGCVF